MISKDFGSNKKLYTVIEKNNESIEIHVFTDNQEFRKVIANHIEDPIYFLKNQQIYEMSDMAAKKWMAKIVIEYREKFRTRKVSFVLRSSSK